MSEKPIRDFVTVVGNNIDPELEQYKIHRVVGDFKVMNGRLVVMLNAVDVPVRRIGSAFWNWIRGKPHITGGLDLDKERQVSFNESLTFLIKDGSPADYLVFAEKFSDLPRSIQTDPYFGTAFQLAYLAKQSDEAKIQLMREAGLQETEIMDKLTQSRTKENEYIKQTMEELSNNSQQEIAKDIEKLKKEGGGGFY